MFILGISSLAHDPAAALELARSLTPAGGLIIATGSIYLVGAVRQAVQAVYDEARAGY